jgi:hypothetical protein
MLLGAGEVGGAEVEVSVEFAFEEGGAAFGVADVFGGVTSDAELDGDGAALERGAEILDALAVRVIETFGDAKDGGEAAGDALIVVVECGVGGVIGIGRGFAIVIADNGGNDVAVAAFEAGDVAVEGEIFSVLVVAAMADTMTDIVKQRSGLEFHAGLRGKVMEGLQVIEKHQAEFADVFGMAHIVFEAAGKAAGADKHLARFGAVAMRLLAREGFAGNFLNDAFADPDGGNEELANVEIAAENDKNDGGDAHDVGAISGDAIGFHETAEIALQDVGEEFAKKRNIESRKSFAARARGDVRECFGISAEGDGKLIGEVRTIGKARFEERANVATDLFGLNGTNSAGDSERGD